jgi:DNA-binding response OmpR family regulator
MKNKKVLAFAIQTDLLLTLEEEILNKCSECRLDIATTFEDARQLMLMFTYDMVISDISTLIGSGLADLTLSRKIPVLLLSNDVIKSETLCLFNILRVKAFLQKKDIKNIVNVIRNVFKSEDLPNWKQDLEKVWNFSSLVGQGINQKTRN